MTEERIERVARAIEAVRAFARYNDWTREHVPGLPIEIVEMINAIDERVVERHPASVGTEEALRLYLRRARARAAIAAMQS